MIATDGSRKRDTEFVMTPLSAERARFFRRKHALERVLAGVLLVPAAPVIGGLVLLIRATSRGPGIFRQTRVGWNGQQFQVLKLRSMRLDAEADGRARWSTQHDPRVTRLGRVLRKLHLDELPQLWNVVRGDMALVGPRPERPEFIVVLEQAIPGYHDRLVVQPGITGLAQINLPPDVDLVSVMRKQELDLQYIREASLLLDLRMVMATALRLFGLKGETVIRLMRLKRVPKVSVDLDARSLMPVEPTTVDAVAHEIPVIEATADAMEEELPLPVQMAASVNGRGRQSRWSPQQSKHESADIVVAVPAKPR